MIQRNHAGQRPLKPGAYLIKLNRMQDEEENKSKDDLEEAVHELMNEYDLDEKEAKTVEKLEEEGYDEEDAVSQAMNASE